MTGICGGYTTFSAFSLQTLNLLRAGDWPRAGAYIVGSVVICLVSVWLGNADRRALQPGRLRPSRTPHPLSWPAPGFFGPCFPHCSPAPRRCSPRSAWRDVELQSRHGRPHDRRPGFRLEPRAGHRENDRAVRAVAAHVAVPRAVGRGDRIVVALLFSRTAAWPGLTSGADRQTERGLRANFCRVVPAGTRSRSGADSAACSSWPGRSCWRGKARASAQAGTADAPILTANRCPAAHCARR